ncbi:hypothetical protein [Enterovirga rhinocerotis]|uniref:Uncharacterized protein n=1 Tax=Enterovirga rhinocerotis TaxID=1339210 RepID=A0A4R7C889_9HYPH|nr:hypothetical protein [Enterovirga rhinocerotis]TDR93056.1 hypothetical protein EV668_0306 [Enterovirga rhinocerotis]
MDEAQDQLDRPSIPGHEQERRRHARKGAARIWEQVRLAPGDVRSRRADLRNCLAQKAREANVDLIIEATKAGSNSFVVPKYLNRRRFREDIDGLRFRINVLYEFHGDRKWRERANILREVEVRAKQLVRLLSSQTESEWIKSRLASERSGLIGEDIKKGEWHSKDVEEFTNIETLLVDLRRLEQSATRALGRDDMKGVAPYPQARSLFQSMISTGLPAIFIRRFRQPITFGSRQHAQSAADREDGPFLRFAEAVLADLGIESERGAPYSRATIAREYRRLTSAGNPKKKVGTSRVSE